MAYSNASIDQIAALGPAPKIVVVTVTRVETEALHGKLRPITRSGRLLRYQQGNLTYYFGRLGSYPVIHFQCAMGSVSVGAAMQAVYESIAQWKPSAIVMVGIAFGVDRGTQRVGDVLVSKGVIPYDPRREGDSEIIRRGGRMAAGPVLLNRFGTSSQWKHKSGRKRAKIIVADLLSGEALIDNVEKRDSLLKEFPEAGGGEMEGAGVSAAAHAKHIEWILVKGICDFADGRKKIWKRYNQKRAASAACHLCAHVFSSADAFSELGCNPLGCNPMGSSPSIGHGDALFDVYELNCEPFYLQREIDTTVAHLLSAKALWITGDSGSGKTNTALRALKRAGVNFHFIDLSPCVQAPIREYFWTIRTVLGSLVSQPTRLHRNCTAADAIREMPELCAKIMSTHQVIFIDEIPIHRGEEAKQFLELMFAMLITLNNHPATRELKFLLSSIFDPKASLGPAHEKVFARAALMRMPFWSEDDLRALARMIMPVLQLDLTQADVDKLIQASANSPRALKTLLRSAKLLKGAPGWNLQKIIAETPLPRTPSAQ